jgi:hypothetical protein
VAPEPVASSDFLFFWLQATAATAVMTKPTH